MCAVPPLSLVVAFCLTLMFGGCANTPPEQAKLDAHGQFDNGGRLKLAVGASAPDFSLNNIQGQPVSLTSFKGEQAVLLVFYRGSWCPFCISQLEDYRRVLPDLKAHKIQLIAISPDPVEKNQAIAERFDTGYLFLSDADSAVIQRYGIQRDETLPHPTLVLIDAAGTIVWFYTDHDYQTRPSAAQLRAAIQTHLGTVTPDE